MATPKFIIEVKTKGFDKLEEQFKAADKAAKGFDNTNGRLRGSTAGLRRTIGSLRNNILLYTFAIAGATKTVGAFVSASAKFEAVRTRLVGLTGSVKEANKVFETFNSVAATTPFTLDDVVNAGAQLKAFGADAEALIEPITDLAAFMGTTATEAANSFGRAYAGGAGAADILRERGILNIIKTSQGLADLSKTTLPQFREALITSLQDPALGIAGSTDRLAKTTTGALSNMSDSFTRLSVVIGDKLKPVTDAAIASLTKLSTKATEALSDKPESRVFELVAELRKLDTEAENNKKAIAAFGKEVLTADEALAVATARTKALVNINKDFMVLSPELQADIIKEAQARGSFTEALEAESQAIEDRIFLTLRELALMEQVNTAKSFEADMLQRITDTIPKVTTATLDLMTVQNQMKELNPIDPIDSALKALDPQQAAAINMTQRLSDTFVQAGINGQNMGQAVVTALKSIAAEIAAQAITFGILKTFFAPGSLSFGFKDFLFKRIGVAHQGGPIQRFAGGGTVQGQDNVPILAQAGEFVIKRDSAQSIGLNALNQMNETGQAASNINVHIHGGIVQEDYVTNELIPAINRSKALA